MDERYCFVAYLISFFLIATTWYNHHYIFSVAKWISKKAFWANCVWLFLMSLTPVSTAWISQNTGSRTVGYFYFLLYILWGLSFSILLRILVSDNPEQAKLLKATESRDRTIFEIASLIVGIVLIYFVPVSCFIVLAVDIFVWIFFTPKGSDRLQENIGN